MASFHMSRYVRSSSGLLELSEGPYDLEEHFSGLRYKSMSGLCVYGAPAVCSESFADSERLEVYIPEEPVYGSTKLELSLCFLSDDGTYSSCDAVYRDFVRFLSGGYLVYWDDVRCRKVLMYLSGSVEVDSDVLYGRLYKEVRFTFTNVYGRTFSLSDPVFEPVID